jgi:hypothetical protein
MQPDLFSPAHDGSGVTEPDQVPVVERLGNEVAALRKIIADLLKHVGQPAVCRGPQCQQGIFMVFHRSGKLTPYNADGTNHFGTCIDRELFRKEK